LARVDELIKHVSSAWTGTALHYGCFTLFLHALVDLC
jgi:hypothetical protein